MTAAVEMPGVLNLDDPRVRRDLGALIDSITWFLLEVQRATEERQRRHEFPSQKQRRTRPVAPRLALVRGGLDETEGGE